MKRVLVSVKSVQRDMDGKDTVVELISPGTSHEKGMLNMCVMKNLV